MITGGNMVGGSLAAVFCVGADPVGAEGVDGEHDDERRVDPARQPEHDVVEAVLLDVVAGAKHERRVDLGPRAQSVGERGRRGDLQRDRVTVEEAPVKLLAATHPVLTTPNKITEADFQGWIQERGLYFTSDWDPRYTTVLASNDPGEPEKPGGQLVAKHGKGTFIYTSYAWWRQLPAGVPGAIKAFVNLVSAK